MFVHACNRHVEHVREVWSSLRAQVHAEALGLNPLENGVEGVSQLPKSGWSCCERKKRQKNTVPQKSLSSPMRGSPKISKKELFSRHLFTLWHGNSP